METRKNEDLVHVVMQKDYYENVVSTIGEAGNVEYIDLTNVGDIRLPIGNLSKKNKAVYEGKTSIGNPLLIDFLGPGWESVNAAEIDFSEVVFRTGSREYTVKDVLIEKFDFNEGGISALPRITKEEFYYIPKEALIKFRDREKLGEIFEDLYAKLTSKGYETPLVDWFPDAPRIDVPLLSLGYGSVTLEVSSGTSENQIVERIYKRNGVLNTNDNWYDYDNPSEEVRGDATYIAFEYGYALSKFISKDGKVIYGCELLAG